MSARSDRPFRFGAVAAGATSGRQWAELAGNVERLGYDVLLAPDTLRGLSPFPALAAAAAVTTTLRLGSYVLAGPLRTPGTVVRETRSMHLLTDGRFELGVGAGRSAAADDARALGLEFGPAGERVHRLEQTLVAVRGAFPEPGAVRVLVAGRGPRLLALAARQADSIALGAPPTAGADEVAELVRLCRQVAPDRFDRLELMTNLVAVGDEAPPWLAPAVGTDLASLHEAGAVSVLRGTPRQMADVLLRRRERLGVTYVSVNAFYAEALAPVIALLR